MASPLLSGVRMELAEQWQSFWARKKGSRMERSIFIGYDDRFGDAFAICRQSIRRHAESDIPIHALCLRELRDAGLYWRPHSTRDGQMWDDISDAPMATQFANSRFLTGKLAGSGWALFLDCDILSRTAIDRLFALADDKYAVMVVKHPNYVPAEVTKMDGQTQTRYQRKNWSSVMLINADHPAHERLTPDMINSLPGRDLHRFAWLNDDEIGELPPEWNWLEGISRPDIDPALCHFTRGIPTLPGYETSAYAGEWFEERSMWLAERSAPPFSYTRVSAYANGAAA